MSWIADLDEADAVRLFPRPAPRRDIEFKPVVCPRFAPRRCRRLWIERDTPIIPQAIAEAVWEEASVWLGEELPREWIRRLAVRADVIYFHNPRFRRAIRRQGNAGRDYLWMFTRHWLAAMIWKRDYNLYTRLPAAYSSGGDLPD
jgi:hypothetical protein